MTVAFLDTNILLRHLLQDHPTLSHKATAILDRIEREELRARISDAVVFEVVVTLQRAYKQPRDRIAEVVLPLIELPGIVLPGKRRYRQVFALYRSGSIGFVDCYHIVLMRQLGLKEILSFDAHFDHLPDIKRLEF